LRLAEREPSPVGAHDRRGQTVDLRSGESAGIDGARHGTGVEQCRIIELPRISDPRGNLTFIESNRHVPFDISRIYYLYDVPGGETRGGHAHRKLEQFVIAVSGSFDVVVRDATATKRFFLHRSYYGLYIPRMVWREMENFSSGSCCLVLASDFYDESDYYRDYDAYVRAIGELR
jgi:dTDP-4-dehydrorhamnose 3,5-epimerase-like enzyme